MLSVVADPNQSIEDITYLWNDDSLCIMEYNVRAINNTGGYEIKQYQYFYVVGDTASYEGAYVVYPSRSTFQIVLDGETRKDKIHEIYRKYALIWGEGLYRRVID